MINKQTTDSERPKAKLLRLLADDSYAASFQTLGQYRSSLIKEIGKIEANESQHEQASRFSVDALVSGTADEIASYAILEGMEHEVETITEAIKEYARQKCRFQRVICAGKARVNLPTHPHLDGTKNVNEKDIRKAREPKFD